MLVYRRVFVVFEQLQTLFSFDDFRNSPWKWWNTCNKNVPICGKMCQVDAVEASADAEVDSSEEDREMG